MNYNNNPNYIETIRYKNNPTNMNKLNFNNSPNYNNIRNNLKFYSSI